MAWVYNEEMFCLFIFLVRAFLLKLFVNITAVSNKQYIYPLNHRGRVTHIGSVILVIGPDNNLS